MGARHIILRGMNPRIYSFCDCTIDVAQRELHRQGQSIALSPKVFDCLAYLIEHRDRAVGRDELIAAVWGRVDVSDTLLGQTILKARRAVGDAGHDRTAIRTIPRFGYSWAADTTVVESARAASMPPGVDARTIADAPEREDGALDFPLSASGNESSMESAAQRAMLPTAAVSWSRRRIAVFALAITAALCLVFLAGVWRQHAWAPVPGIATAPSKAVPGGVHSENVAVMPVATAVDDNEAWLRLGLMDFIAHRLRRAGQPVVPSDNVVALLRTSVAGATISDAAVRRATGASYLVVPRVERTLHGWRVQLLLHATGEPRVFEAQGADVIATAADAADHLLLALGKSVPDGRQTSSALSLADIQQRAEAALLSDDFAGARRIIETAPPSLRNAPELRLRLAQIAFRSGQFTAARNQLQTLLDETPAGAEPILRARALYTVGAVALREDRSDDAERAFAEAAALSTRQDNPAVRGQAFMGLAAARVNLGRYDEAADDLARARIALGMADDTLALARVDANEGVLDNARGRPAEALPVLRRAAERFRSFGALNELFLTVAAETKAHLALLDPAAALAASNSAWATADTLDNPRSRSALGVQHARALAAVGRVAEAERLLEELSRSFAPDEQSGLPGDVASSRAQLHLAAGDAPRAIVLARDAMVRLPTIDEMHERARAWLTLIRALRRTGDDAGAAAQTRQFSAWGATANAQGAALYAVLAEAEQARADHAAEAADRDYASALAEAERRGVPADLAEVTVSYADALLADGKIERAGAVIGRVARWADRDFDCAVLQLRLYRALGEQAASATALVRARGLAGERAIPATLDSSSVPALDPRPGG